MKGVEVISTPNAASRWVRAVMDAVENCPDTTLVRVSISGTETDGRPRGRLLKLYERLDRWVFSGPEERAERGRVPLAKQPTTPGLGIDLVIDLGGGGERPGDAAAAEVWTIAVGGVGGQGSIESEFARGARCLAVSLYSQTVETAGTELLERSVSRLDEVSLHRNRAGAQRTAVAMIDRQLARRAAGPRRAASTGPGLAAVPTGDHLRSSRYPRLHGIAGVPFRMGSRLAAKRWHRDRWRIHIRPASDGLPRPLMKADGVVELRPPRDSYYADPYLFEREGEVFLFFEEYLHDQGRGRIAVSKLDRDGRPDDPRPVLERSHHLSYPYVFEKDGEVFMLPESGEVRSVELYRAIEFPVRWEPIATILSDVPAYDPTLVEVDGLFWLWVAVPTPGGVDADELLLFSADEIAGPYAAHPQNPVQSDVRCARPAGRPLVVGQELVRPAQDGSEHYGARIRWMAVDEMSLDRYRESQIAYTAPPGGGFVGVHTFTRAGNWEAYDLLPRGRPERFADVWHRR